jgi:type IV pilus assembly protein PilM
VGVDISDTSLKYIQFVREHPHNTQLTIKHWGDLSVPSGVLERGNVHNVGQLTAILAEMKEQCGAEYVNVSLPEEHAYLFETTVPMGTPEKDIRGLLEFKLEENVPLSPRDAYFDYEVVGEDAPNHLLRIVVAVYAQSTINNYYQACIDAKLIPLSFEIEAQSIARASIPNLRQGTYMVVDFGRTRMGVGIVHHGMLMYTSTIEIAGDQMSQDIRAVLGNIAESEITAIKNTRGLLHTKDNEATVAIFEKYTERIVEELSIRMHYWHTRGIDRIEREIKKIIVCGGSINLLGFPEFLSTKLEIPVERAQVWENALTIGEHVPPITRRYSYGYATAIGLALKNFDAL